MNLIEEGEQWLFTVAAKKVVTIIVKFLMAYGSSVIVQHYLTQFGITVNQATFQAEATTAMMAAIEVGHDYLKLHYPEYIKF